MAHLHASHALGKDDSTPLLQQWALIGLQGAASISARASHWFTGEHVTQGVQSGCILFGPPLADPGNVPTGEWTCWGCGRVAGSRADRKHLRAGGIVKPLDHLPGGLSLPALSVCMRRIPSTAPASSSCLSPLFTSRNIHPRCAFREAMICFHVCLGEDSNLSIILCIHSFSPVSRTPQALNHC